ncbi:hypothetical protein [Methylocystis sp. ATCC 49242]|uniref:hypothetical protein n=1 Tax=Methylocystis sp. ATCC 49242 TaxID=622637 RepID=UPI0001F88816|nr:hypothetical protein [Methylocystis sp. ATCC 49242]
MAAAPCIIRALRQMWREQFDYFWDGRRRLVIGCFDGAESPAAIAARPQLTLVSARDEDFSIAPTLIDVIDAARWRARIVISDIPSDHRFLRLFAADGSELRLVLGSEREQPPGGEWRLLMTLLPEAESADPVSFRLVPLPARGDLERLAREQTASAGARLVWAIGQRRAVERSESGALVARLAPARRIFPAFQNRLTLEAMPFEAEAAADTREAPFAIMQHWLREQGAPRAALRLRIPDSLEESAALLGRTSVALVLQQRRHLRGWMQEQKQAGEPVIDPLSFEDIRQATGEPGEHPDAVESSDAVVVANLLNLILDPEGAEADGVTVRRGDEKNPLGLGETVEIDFYGAALGDDIGLICPTAAAGDIGVAPADPGGPPFARLLRVEGDGLTPRRIGEDEPLLDDMMRRAAAAARATTSGPAARIVAERAAGLRSRREKFVAVLNDALARASFKARFESAGLWDVFEPLAQTSFAALVADASAPARSHLEDLGGYAAYGVDPALTAALARGGVFAQAAQSPRFRSEARATPSLLQRYVAACGLEGITPAELDPAGQADALRALTQEQDALALREARIGLAADAGLRRAAVIAARQLADESAVELAIVHFEQSHDGETAARLADYLNARRAGEWTPPEHARTLAALLARAGVEREEAQTRVAAGMTAAAAAPPPSPPPSPPPPEKPKGFFRRLFGG